MLKSKNGIVKILNNEIESRKTIGKSMKQRWHFEEIIKTEKFMPIQVKDKKSTDQEYFNTSGVNIGPSHKYQQIKIKIWLWFW